MASKELSTTVVAVETDSMSSRHGEDAEMPESRRSKKLSWWKVALIITGATNSLGLLSLPMALSPLGIVPSAVLIPFFGIVDWYTGYVVYLFVMRNPHAHSYADMMNVIFGMPGKVIGGLLQSAVLIFIMAAHLIGWGITMGILSDGRLNLPGGILIGMVVMGMFTVPRSMKDGSWLAALSCLSIVAAIAIGGVGVSLAYPDFPNGRLIVPPQEMSLALCCKAVSSLLFVFMGHIAYPAIIAEMREPRDFPRALRVQSLVTIVFAEIVALYFYSVVGAEVESPVLSSATGTLRKVAYGVAIPTVMVAAVVSCVVAARFIYETFWTLQKQPEVVKESSIRAKVSWWCVILFLWLISTITACTVNPFDRTVPFIGAAFGPTFCLILPPLFWSRLRGPWSTLHRVARERPAMALLNLLIFLMGFVLLALGLYGSIQDFSTTGGQGESVSWQLGE